MGELLREGYGREVVMEGGGTSRTRRPISCWRRGGE